MPVTPVCEPPREARFHLEGWMGDRLQANLNHWLLTAPVANPAILQMFRDRDRQPRRALVPWAGEFAGKYLISAVQGYRLGRDRRLRDLLRWFVKELISVQDTDGYLGPHPKSERLTGKTHDGQSPLWDLWGHYHCMLGLLLWWRETGDTAALQSACKAADLVCRRFLDSGTRILSAGAEEMNMAISHVFCLLYQATGNARYLQMAREIEKDWETPPAGDYVRTALRGTEFYQTPKPRWESLPNVQAIAELYFITGDERYRRAVLHIYHSIRKTDRHNTGAFSSAEQAVGNPYDPRPIESCCVIAWMALCIDVLRITGDPTVADELELATYNAVLGAQHPSGRWWTYNTPMDGVRRASAHDIVFQAHQGAPELNCCAVNAPRGLGMLSEWMVMRTAEGVNLNYYGAGKMQVPLTRGRALTLDVQGDYPRRPDVQIGISVTHPTKFTLYLRIPAWSQKTGVWLNGQRVPDMTPGTYLPLQREWRSGDTLRIRFDFNLHAWLGEREQAGKVALYRGPILLAYDQRFNTMDPDNVPTLSFSHLHYAEEQKTGMLPPLFLLRFTGTDGRALRLCDFAGAGVTGTVYRSWLPVRETSLPDGMRSPFAV
ncbi:hypothetical protein HRbin16_01359 [bacterium HR16]|nr:hypothetical protein HRbin16_01359 [bacterium HR16]